MNNISIDQILFNLNITQLNEMQEASLEACKKHSDVLLLSPTGSGKTLAFLLPLLEKLKPASEEVQALIIVPTRELAKQIETVFLACKTDFVISAFYGGQFMKKDVNQLTKKPSVIVGTPGRIIDHMDRKTFSIDKLTTLVLDEFDKSLELGFHDEMSYIVRQLPSVKFQMFTSATQSVRIPEFVKMSDLYKLNYTHEVVKSKLEVKLVHSVDKDKLQTLGNLLKTIGNEQSIVFSNHRDSSDRIEAYLREEGFFSVVFHGGMEQKDRELALMKFRNKSANVLVSTDLAARGLDIPEIEHVIHYHLPHKHEEFIHRNGRTARMEASGVSYILKFDEEQLPAYIKLDAVDEFKVYTNAELPRVPDFVSIFIGAGKRAKINKIDIVGFLSKKGGLQRNELGLVVVQDHVSYAAVSTARLDQLFEQINDQKIKGKKVKFGLA